MVGWVEGGGSEIHIYTACNKEKKLSNRNVLCIMIFYKGVRIENKTQHGESGYFFAMLVNLFLGVKPLQQSFYHVTFDIRIV